MLRMHFTPRFHQHTDACSGLDMARQHNSLHCAVNVINKQRVQISVDKLHLVSTIKNPGDIFLAEARVITR